MTDPTPPEAFHVTPSPKTAGLLHANFHGIPLVPVIGLSALAIAGILIYRKVKGGTATTNTTPTTSPAVPTAGTVADDSGDTGGWANIGGGAAYDGVTSSGNSNTSSFSSNQAWANNAINGLVGQTTLGNNTYSPIDIQNAIMNEINGIPLASALQQEIVNAAIAAYGEPPQSVSQTTPAQQTATVTSAYHPYTVKQGDTISAILQSTYGQVDTAVVAAFWAANSRVFDYENDHLTAASSAPASLNTPLAPGIIINLPIFTEGTLP